MVAMGDRTMEVAAAEEGFAGAYLRSGARLRETGTAPTSPPYVDIDLAAADSTGKAEGLMNRVPSKSPRLIRIEPPMPLSSATVASSTGDKPVNSPSPVLRKPAQSQEVAGDGSSVAAAGNCDGCTRLAGHFDRLARPTQLVCLACGVFLFFGGSNYLQEALVRMDGFRPYAWALGVFEMTGIFISTAAERRLLGETDRRASRMTYAWLALCLTFSSSLSTMSLRYINYPTKIVGRSCKLLPTLAVAVIWNRRPLLLREVVAAAAVSAGLVAFALGDRSVSPDFDVRGIGLVMLSVCGEALLPNLQERAFEEGASRSEMMFYTNLCTMLAMSFSVGISGGLWGAMRFAFSNPTALCYIVMLTAVAYLAIFCHMHLVKRFGGVTTVFVGSARKACNIVVSFVMFEKPFTPIYLVAGALVLSGLLFSSLGELRERRRNNKRSAGEKKVKSGKRDKVGEECREQLTNPELPPPLGKSDRARSSPRVSAQWQHGGVGR